MQKQKKALSFGLFSLLIFAGLRSYSFYESNNQRKLIVYNIQNTQAIDFINGRKFICIGDPAALNDRFIQNFYLQPARTINRTVEAKEMVKMLSYKNLYSFGGKTFLLLAQPLNLPKEKTSIDALILSKNPKIFLPGLLSSIHPRIVIADASNRAYISGLWKRQCDSLGVAFHNVAMDGAFQMELK